jgi:hypothetical protein
MNWGEFQATAERLVQGVTEKPALEIAARGEADFLLLDLLWEPADQTPVG